MQPEKDDGFALGIKLFEVSVSFKFSQEFKAY